MKKLITFVLIIFVSTQINASPIPSWISEIGPCENGYICVVGTGQSSKDAKSDGRAEFAKFFETKVKIESNTSSKSINLKNSIMDAKYEEWSSKLINEEADEVLSGIEVKNEFAGTDQYFVLMSLSKNSVAKKFKDKFLDLDNQNMALIKRGNRFVLPKIAFNLSKMARFKDRYMSVSESELKAQFSEKMYIHKISDLKTLQIAIEKSSEDVPGKILHLLASICSPLKINISHKIKNPDQWINIQFKSDEDYLKVEGFKKLNIILALELKNLKNEVVGKLNISSNTVARNKNQAIEKVLPDLENQLIENLGSLGENKIGE
jgi:hypothetical protein